MKIAELSLTKAEHNWLNGWLELWGSWIYSGRLDRRQSSIIAKFMERADPGRVITRPMCNDDDGMLISQVVDSVMCIDKKAFGILLSYYVYGASRLSISMYHHRVAKPRNMGTRAGGRYKKPSLKTCRREIDDVLNSSLYLIYHPLLTAMKNRKRVPKIREIIKLCS